MPFFEHYCDPVNGDNMNGGSDPGSSPTYTATNGGWNSSTGVFTPTSGNPSAVSPTLVGQTAHVFTDGSTTPTRVARVTAVSSTTLTLSTSAGSGTAPTTAGSGISVRVGGAWKGPNGAVGFPVGTVTGALTDVSTNCPRINFKNNGTYAITATMTHSTAGLIAFSGYSSTPGDGGRATIDGGSGTAYVLFQPNAQGIMVSDIIFQNNGSLGSAAGVSGGGFGVLFRRCVFRNMRGNGVLSTSAHNYIECEAYNCNTSNSGNQAGFFNNGQGTIYVRCVSYDNAGFNTAGFRSSNASIYLNCVADSNGNAGFLTSSTSMFVNCSAYGNAAQGIYSFISNAFAFMENCILANNSTHGITASGPLTGVNNAFFNNTSGQLSGAKAELVGSVTLSGTPFVDAANGDFDLNNTSGAGAACRGTGSGAFAQTAPGYTGTLSYPDIGAVQHQDAGGGGGGGGTVTGARLIGPSALVTPGGCV